MAGKPLSKIALAAIVLFFALFFGVIGVAFAGKWVGGFPGDGADSVEQAGLMAGISGADTTDNPETTVIAFAVQRSSDDDDDDGDDDGDNDNDDDNDDDHDNDDDSDDDGDNDNDDDDGNSKPVVTNTNNQQITTNQQTTNKQLSTTTSSSDDDDDDNDGDDDDNDNDDDDDNDNDDDDDNDNDDDDDNDGDDDDDNDGDDDDNDGDDDDNDNDDDDDDGSNNLVTSSRYGSLLKEVKANPALAKGVAGHIKRAGGARPLGSTSTTTSQETSSTTQSSFLSGGRASKTRSTTQSSYIFTTSNLLSADPVSTMSSTTQSSYLSGGRVSDPSYFLAELDASGNVEFTFNRKTGSTVTALSTTDEDASSRRVDDLASGWKGVETHKDATNGVFNWDAYTDSRGNSDSDYLSFGSWLFIYKDSNDGSYTGSYALGVAAGGNDPFDNGNLAGLTGTASYRGPASGLRMTKASTSADPEFDYFDARADLAVDFGDATAPGTVSGTITRGRTDGGLTLPDLTLGSADIAGSAPGGNFDGDVSGTTDGGAALSGKWGGKFFGNRTSSTHPDSAAGTFGANTSDGLLSIVGSFGAKRTQ